MWAGHEPAWVADVAVADGSFPRAAAAAAAGLRSGFAFPVRGTTGLLGVIEFFVSERRELDDDLLETMSSLGSQIGQFVERCRAQTGRPGERRAQERDPQRRASTAS